MKWALREFPALPLRVFLSLLAVLRLSSPAILDFPVLASAAWVFSSLQPLSGDHPTMRPALRHFPCPDHRLGCFRHCRQGFGTFRSRTQRLGSSRDCNHSAIFGGNAARPRGLHFSSFRAPIIGPRGCPHPRWRRCLLCSQGQLPLSPLSRTH